MSEIPKKNGLNRIVAQVEPMQRPMRRAWRLFYLVADSAAYAAGAYLCVRIAFLRIEGFASLPDMLTVFMAAALFLLV